LGEDKDGAALYGAVSGDHAVAEVALFVQAKVAAAVAFEHIILFEAPVVQEQV
jgi:hypothetical protein